MRIQHNISALSTSNSLALVNQNLGKAIERLSTGLRVNSAADDAAGLAISEKMRAQIRGLDRAVANAQDGISMIQTAEGALNESHSILQRMRELAVQAANDTLTSEDRTYIQVEIDQLKEELDRIASTTQFNKKKLLNGSADAEWSTDGQGAWVNIKGTLASEDAFGQKTKQDGNYRITVSAVQSGKGQVLKSNIFRHAIDGSPIAGCSSRLKDLENFFDNNGRFILEDPQTLTISLEGGGTTSVTIYADDTLGSLGEKLSSAVMMAGEQTVQQGSAAQFVGAEVSVVDESDTVPYRLASSWLEGAAKRISDYYGITGTGKTLVVQYTDNPADPDGRVSYNPAEPDKVIMTLKKSTFDPDRPDFESLANLVMHEMVHAVTFSDPSLMDAQHAGDGSGMWLIEGLTEYMRGTVYNVQQHSKGDLLGFVNNILGASTGNYQTYYGNADNYNGAYLAVRFFDEQSRASGGGGIKALIEELQKVSGPHSDATMDAAIAIASGGAFSGRVALRASLNGADGSDFLDKVLLEDPFFDSGAIGGRYASNGPPLTSATVTPAGSGYKQNPLADYGWAGVDLSAILGAASTGNALARSDAKANTLQSVEGTLLLHSTLAGNAGRISISGDDRLLAALGFAEVQKAQEVVYEVSIMDAHTNKMVASGVRISGNAIMGVLHDNVDILLANNFGLQADGSGTLQDGYGTFQFSSAGLSSFVVHLAATSTKLQIGANEGEDLALSFGNNSAKALGVDKVKLVSRELASRAITQIDGAISTVSERRARLGAYQNRLEHAIANLTTASTNTVASESSIRDTDMAKEMMAFTKLNILSQAGNSMLAQANQLPQNTLQLMR